MTANDYRLFWFVVGLVVTSALVTLLFFVPDPTALPTSAKAAIVLWTLLCFAVGAVTVPQVRP